MDKFFDWSDEAIAPMTPAKTKQAEEIARQVEEFLAAGGEIEKVPYDPIPEMVGAASGSLKRSWPTLEGMTKATPTEYGYNEGRR